jgi:predicted acetyltransferase
MAEKPQLVTPDHSHLWSYAAALRTGWSPNNVRNVAAEQLAEIEANPDMFLRDLVALDGTVTLPDGSVRQRLPQILRWIWDGAYAGTISLRWQPGSDDLPPHVLGHIGYAVVPWKRGHGYARQALAEMLLEARNVGLRSVELTTDPANLASIRVIEGVGGRFVEEFVSMEYGGASKLRYRIGLGA